MTQPGWYPDPSDPTQQRYWDGSAWTSHAQPAGQQQLPPQRQHRLNGQQPPAPQRPAAHERKRSAAPWIITAAAVVGLAGAGIGIWALTQSGGDEQPISPEAMLEAGLTEQQLADALGADAPVSMNLGRYTVQAEVQNTLAGTAEAPTECALLPAFLPVDSRDADQSTPNDAMGLYQASISTAGSWQANVRAYDDAAEATEHLDQLTADLAACTAPMTVRGKATTATSVDDASIPDGAVAFKLDSEGETKFEFVEFPVNNLVVRLHVGDLDTTQRDQVIDLVTENLEGAQEAYDAAHEDDAEGASDAG